MVKDHDFYVLIGKKGRLVMSEAQKQASRLNGRLGGWPKGRKRGPKSVKSSVNLTEYPTV
jgi:hypothetical protein